MTRHAVSWPTLFAALSLAACKFVAPDGSGATTPVAAPADVTAAESHASCPGELDVSDQGQVDLEQDPSREGPAYDAIRFAPEHRKPVIGDASFALAAPAAVDRAVAIEAKSPSLVPSGFRQEVVTQGRAAAFRLRMAECELDRKELQRRAAIDLGLALLLGASEELVTAKMQKLSEPPECRSVSNGGEQACMVARGAWNDSRKVKVSATELLLEDAVSRGLASLPKTVDEPHSNVGVLLFRLAHKCGGSGVCLSRADQIDGAVRFVHWDRRDGGAHRDVKVSAATTKANKRCKDATGWEGQEACLQACWSGGRSGADGATCRTRCLAFCDPH